MITYRWGGTEYAVDDLEVALRSGLAKRSCFYSADEPHEYLQRQVNALEDIVVALLLKLPAEEALELVGCFFVSEG
jgi:hypothetical protein